MYITIITVAKKESERERLEMEWVINFRVCLLVRDVVVVCLMLVALVPWLCKSKHVK